MGRFERRGNFGRRDSGGSDRREYGRDSGRFGRDSDRSEGRGFGRFRSRDSGGFGERRRPLEMHEVTCDRCGMKCEVPFRPTAGKPVYCSDCFKKNEGKDQRSSASSESYKKDFEQLNKKLDRILKLLLEAMESEDDESEDGEDAEESEESDDAEDSEETKTKEDTEETKEEKETDKSDDSEESKDKEE